MIRAQYYFRDSDDGLLAWDVRRLVELTKDYPVKHVPLSAIAEIDEAHWYAHEGDSPTCRSLLDHMRLIDEVDLAYPIILDEAGRVMDGMHRVCRAVRDDNASIRAVQFARNPEPDYVGCDPRDLPYDNRQGPAGPEIEASPIQAQSIFAALESASDKPPPFSVYTASELWTDEHTSEQMLSFHLNGEIDVSSRRTDFIDDSVDWLTAHFALSDKSRVIDFGCGPGLYTSRFARSGASVVGIDFSSRSIEYAKAYAKRENLEVTYIEADYLDIELQAPFDLVTMIMCDFCALSPMQRATMLKKFATLLSAEGHIVLDVYSLRAFAEKQEGVVCEKNQLNGFWSANPYFGIVASFKYEDEKVGLDKYTIVEKDRQREIYNWLQYFSPQSLEREIRAAGLQVVEFYGDVSGRPYDADAPEFAVVVTRQ